MRDPNIGTVYVDAGLRPKPPSPLAALLNASAAPSLSDYIHNMAWMHPLLLLSFGTRWRATNMPTIINASC